MFSKSESYKKKLQNSFLRALDRPKIISTKTISNEQFTKGNLKKWKKL